MFSGTNWDDYEMLFFVTALRRGSIGYRLWIFYSLLSLICFGWSVWKLIEYRFCDTLSLLFYIEVTIIIINIGLQFVKESCLKSESTIQKATEALENSSAANRVDQSFNQIEDEHKSMEDLDVDIDTLSADDKQNRQDLFADIMGSITPSVYKRLKYKDNIYAVIKTVDHIKLWCMLNEIAIDWDMDSSKIDQKILEKKRAYGLFHGIYS
jgi:hypothetical protein